jgi:putative heme-binding domain-containing protein
VLQADGATFKTQDSDFLVSDNPDFHPTDVIEDADGSLIVIDTGAWYKLCCPTSQLSKPDVLGAIYRIRRTSAPRIADPLGLQIAWSKLEPSQAAGLLSDHRPAVRRRALLQLSKAGPGAVPALSQAFQTMSAPSARANVVWGLTRIAAPSARAAVRLALEDPDELVRHAAIHSTALWRDSGAQKQLLALLQSSNSQIQRAAAEALGRVGDKSAVPALLRVSAQRHDRVLEHSLIFALIEIGDSAGTAVGVNSENPNEKRSALIALDQMEHSELHVETVAPLLNSSDPTLRQTAVWIAEHHPEWGDALAGLFKERLEAKEMGATDSAELKGQLAEFAQSKPVQEIIGSRLNDRTAPKSTRLLLLETVTMAGLKEPPRDWSEGVQACLADKDELVMHSAVAAAGVLAGAKTKDPGLNSSLLRFAGDQSRPADLRIAALAALPSGAVSLDKDLLGLLCANIDPAKPVITRSAAAGVLAKAKLTDEELLTLADTIKLAGPLEVTRILESFEQSTNEVVGVKLLDSLQGSKSLASLRPDTLEKLLSHYPATVREQGNQLLASLKLDTAKQSAHLEELMGLLDQGDIRRGQAIFNSQKAACSSCHTMGYLGGRVGPDLTTIGQIRTKRDLLESVVYPSASFVRSFEPYIVKTKSDDEYSGVLKKEAADEIVLATGPATEVRIPRADIVDMRPGTVSVMPAGLDQQLSPQELADLIAFLKGTKWGAQ